MQPFNDISGAGEQHDLLSIRLVGSLAGPARAKFSSEYGMTESGIDEGIEYYVDVLRAGGIETCQSCEGGPGHSYPEPTVDFRGDQSEGPRAVAIALAHGLPALELRRTWEIRDGEMVGPLWALTFRMKVQFWRKQMDERNAAVSAAMGKTQS